MKVVERGNKQGGRAEAVYAAIREKILDLSIEPGQPLTEESLAQTLEVSRTPVREALRMLERDQLVEGTHNKGFVARGISAEDVVKIFELRAVLESWAASEAAREISDNNLAVIGKRLAEAKIKLEQGENDTADRLGNEIHNIIAFVVDNRWFTKISNDLSNFTVAYKKLASMQEGQLARAQKEHENIYGALEAHDTSEAARLMMEHINNSQNLILKALRERTYPGGY